MKKPIKIIFIVLGALVSLFLLATVIYLIWLLFDAVIPMAESFFYALFKGL